MDFYKVTPEVVHHIAKLAALDLGSGEDRRFVEELNAVLEYMKQIASLNTESLEATFQTREIQNVFRKDQPAPSLSPEEVLQNAPDQETAFIKAPPILETLP